MFHLGQRYPKANPTAFPSPLSAVGAHAAQLPDPCQNAPKKWPKEWERMIQYDSITIDTIRL